MCTANPGDVQLNAQIGSCNPSGRAGASATAEQIVSLKCPTPECAYKMEAIIRTGRVNAVCAGGA
jgi:hypothetical protein